MAPGNFPSAQRLDLPFDAAIGFVRNKVDLPSQRWDDLLQGMHSRAFVVAGVTKSSLLSDLRGAVDTALADGRTLEQFRADFDTILDRHGWNPKGGRAWRAQVIYRTNLSTAYAAGHYQQMMADGPRQVRPYWRYIRTSSANPRQDHLAYVGTVLPHDHPWWDTHYPPNGWGCKCGVTNHSAREIERLKAEGESIRTEPPREGTKDVTDPRSGVVNEVPAGIDRGWDYNPGQAAWGRKLTEQEHEYWKAQGKDAWEELTGDGTWETWNRPGLVPADEPVAMPGPRLTTPEQAEAALKELFGGEDLYVTFSGADDFRYDLVVNAHTLAHKLPLDRSPWFPFLRETIENPYEVWSTFARHKGTGKVVLRTRFIKSIAQAQKDRAVFFVAEAQENKFVNVTMVATSRMRELQKRRRGELWWARD